MKTLVLGASGATGSHLVNQLLITGQKAKVIVREGSNLPDNWRKNKDITIITANISELTPEEMAEHIKDCNAIISCLGHNLSFRGIYGKPRSLVTDAIKLLISAINKIKPEKPFRFVLMNTAGYRDAREPISPGGRLMLSSLRLLVPPHADNEHVAEFLRKINANSNPYIEWVIVRPVNLIDSPKITAYKITKSPLSNSIFTSDKTSRINVADFINQLIVNENLWNKWKGKMPVIYN